MEDGFYGDNLARVLLPRHRLREDLMRSPEDVERGRARFAEVNPFPAPTSDVPFVRDGVIASVFGDLWTRDGLSDRDRRLISLTCACEAAVRGAIEQHLRSALVSGDLSVAELQEFLLHFAYYAGWPRASLVHQILTAVVAELGPASEPAGEAGSDARA
jgi:4-carboxymuconolactone decarboxylase